MDFTPLKVAAVVLNRHDISMCTTGELALNYYNVPRVCHGLEICISNASSSLAAELLCSTGLFETCELTEDVNDYTAYKQGLPRVQTTGWCPPQSIVIFTAAFFGLEPIDSVLIPPVGEKDIYISKQIQLHRKDISNLRLPKLAPLLKGFAARFLDTKDDIAMIAVEQLVDGMDLDETWIQSQLGNSDAAIVDLITKQLRSKKSRIDYFMDNQITCFISDKAETEKVRLIPGFE